MEIAFIGEQILIKDSVLWSKYNIKRSTYPGGVMGYGSYLGTNTKLSNTRVGKFCSIAADVSILFRNHLSRDFVSTHNTFCFKKGYSVYYTSVT